MLAGFKSFKFIFQERRVIEMFKLNKPARQEQCFTMTSQDCVLSDWSQWIITGNQPPHAFICFTALEKKPFHRHF